MKPSVSISPPSLSLPVSPCLSITPPSAGDVPSYSVSTLAVVIAAPILVLLVLSAVAMLVFRRIHQHQMERLTARDPEYGTLDGLIASNVGDSTLAVSRDHVPWSLINFIPWSLTNHAPWRAE